MAEPRQRTTRTTNSARAATSARAASAAPAQPRQRARAASAAPPQPRQPAQAESQERSLADLFANLTENLRGLVQREIELARIETKDQISRGVQSIGMFAGAGVIGFVALLLLSFAAAWGLAELVAPGVAFLIVGVVFVLVAGLLFLQGKKKFKEFQPMPRQAMETLKQDVQVAKQSLSEGVSTDDSATNPQWSTAGSDDQNASRRS